MWEKHFSFASELSSCIRLVEIQNNMSIQSALQDTHRQGGLHQLYVLVAEIRYFRSISIILGYNITPVRLYFTLGLQNPFWALPLGYSVPFNLCSKQCGKDEEGLNWAWNFINYRSSLQCFHRSFLMGTGFDAPEACRALSGTERHGRVWLKWVSRLIQDVLKINTS